MSKTRNVQLEVELYDDPTPAGAAALQERQNERWEEFLSRQPRRPAHEHLSIEVRGGPGLSPVWWELWQPPRCVARLGTLRVTDEYSFTELWGCRGAVQETHRSWLDFEPVDVGPIFAKLAVKGRLTARYFECGWWEPAMEPYRHGVRFRSHLYGMRYFHAAGGTAVYASLTVPPPYGHWLPVFDEQSTRPGLS